MNDNFLETHINLVFFFAGAGVGILGGLLSGFCVTSYYRWFDYYNAEVKIHPSIFPISIDFWVFIVSLIAILGIGFFVYWLIIKFIEKIKIQQRLTDSPVKDEEPDKQNIFPIVIEKCPICGKTFNGQSDYCEICGKQLSEKENNKPNRFANFFDGNITNLFIIMAAIGALISLFPIFSDFLIGPDWLNVLLSTELGFLTLTLLLLASYAGAIFMLVILISMMRSIYSKIVDNTKYSDPEKIASSVLMLIGAVSIFASVLFLLLIWIVKFDFAIYYNLLIIILIGESIAVIVGYYVVLLLAPKVIPKPVPKIIPKPIAIILLLILIAGLCFYFVVPFTVDSLTNISRYYTDKSVIVKINGEVINQNNKTPVILLLNKTIDAFFTKDLSIFDVYYAQCHWSTNYGYFFTITSNNSIIKRQSQELIIQGCGDAKDKIYWTYDIGDYGKNKPPFIVGLTLEDRNKKVNNLLGDAHLMINWTDTDAIKFDNESFLFSNE